MIDNRYYRCVSILEPLGEPQLPPVRRTLNPEKKGGSFIITTSGQNLRKYGYKSQTYAINYSISLFLFFAHLEPPAPPAIRRTLNPEKKGGSFIITTNGQNLRKYGYRHLQKNQAQLFFKMPLNFNKFISV